MLNRAADAARSAGVSADWIRSDADLAEGRFDPLALATTSQCPPREDLAPIAVRERGFMPTELVLLLRLAGLTALNIWGGTAGNWGRIALDLDEIEIMIVGCKTAEYTAASCVST
ncbi:MAG: hypothetical protein A4E49_03302 [Methanosaeta sp. PtaU1.Bin112]|nr:MAG: hypothetical protein A4E49_03302 [Methanosaeta sp. PtaU1.Bin112]